MRTRTAWDASRGPVRATSLAVLTVTLGTVGCDLVLDAIPDGEAPRVQILEPAASAPRVTTQAAIVMRGTALDDRRVDRVTVVEQGREKELTVPAGRAVSFTFNGAAGGASDSLEVRAYDAAGNRGVARIAAPIQDVTPPTIELTRPAGELGWTTGAVRIAGSASDANGVTRVVLAFSYGGGPITSMATIPATFDTLVTVSRTGNIRVTAHDVVGNEAYVAFHVPVDRAPPTLALHYARPLSVVEPEAHLYFSAQDSESGLDSVTASATADTVLAGAAADLWYFEDALSVGAGAGGMTLAARDRVGNRGTLTAGWQDRSFARLHGSGGHACVLAADGAAYCLGPDDRGQLGNGPADTTARWPVAVVGSQRFTALCAGPWTTCGIDADGAAYCWGANTHGQLGDGTTTDRDEPVPVQGGRVLTEVHPAERSTCALDDAGTPRCWGRLPRVIDGAVAFNIVPTPRAIATPVPLTALRLSPDGSHACGLDAAGAVYCWGQVEGYDSAAAPGTYDTAAVKVGDGPFQRVQPVPAGDEWTRPWTLLVAADGAVSILGGDASTRWLLPEYGDGPFDDVIVEQGQACAVVGSEVRACGSWLGPSVGAGDARRYGLEAAALTAAPCFLTPAGSLYCRNLDD